MKSEEHRDTYFSNERKSWKFEKDYFVPRQSKYLFSEHVTHCEELCPKSEIKTLRNR